MSPKNRPLIAGLAAPGLLWLATSVAFGQAAPAPLGPPIPAPTSPTTYRALLLSSGQVVKGEITEDAAARVYRLRGNGGTVPYPKTMVLKAAASLEELYQFQVARLPVGDPDERMKLAKWCLAENLNAQAKEQLEALQTMCPGEDNVKRMLYNLAASTAERPRVDPDIRRTSAEAPGSLDPRFMAKVQRRFNALPQIFDLPQAQAVVRANEFAGYVQPVLQKNCVKCHNEKYQGDFQLVEIKQNRDWSNPDVARANLDATLRLVNPDDPTRSELLSACLVPHGGNKNAIFRGPNDPPYTILVTWVKNLRPASNGPKGAGDPAGRTGYPPSETTPGDGFATDRLGRANGSMGAQPRIPQTGLPQLPGSDFSARVAASGVAPPARVNAQSYNESADFVTSPGDNPQFPAPFVVAGVPPLPQPAPLKTRQGAPSSRGTTPPRSPVLPKTATPANPSSVVVGPTDNPNQLPGMDQPLYPTSPKADPDGTKIDPASKKPKKIDNTLLEKLMKNRNGGTP